MSDWFQNKNAKAALSYSNEEWLDYLRHPAKKEALEALRLILLKGLTSLLASRVKYEPDQLAEDIVQIAMIKILDNLQTFRGDSKFATWAMKIAVREAFSELRHKRWNDVSLDELMEPSDAGGISFQITDSQTSPDTDVARKMLLDEIVSIIEQEMTNKQRLVMQCIVLHGMPLEVVADLLHTNRNNLYKLMHDARKRLRNEFEKRGYDLTEILNNL